MPFSLAPFSGFDTRQAATAPHAFSKSNFVPSPNARGTLDILFGCIFTILLCAWIIQRPNIPFPEPPATTWRQKLRQALKQILNQTKYLLLTLIAPELWIGKAYQDFMTARRSCQEMKALAEIDGVEWTMTHAYFANMGGFKFKVEGDPWDDESLGSSISRSTISLMSLERVYETIRRKTCIERPDEKAGQPSQDGAMLETGGTEKQRTISIHSSRIGPPSVHEIEIESTTGSQETPPSSVSSHSAGERDDASSTITGRTDNSHNSVDMFDPYYIYPNADQIKAMRELGVIHLLPELSLEEIAGLGNGNLLAKAIVILQVSWFVLQIIAKAAKHLPISQLEISTLAFVICAILMHLLFWSVPQGITTSIEVNRNMPIHGATLNSFTNNLLRLSGYSGFDVHFLPGQSKAPNPRNSPPNDVMHKDGPWFTKQHGFQQHPYVKIGIALAGTLFGLVHCSSWSFSFPTLAEKIIWRTASLYISVCFISWPAFSLLTSDFAPNGLKDVIWRAAWVSTLVANMIYAVARLSLIVLVFRCLFHLPAEAFVTCWADRIPHLS